MIKFFLTADIHSSSPDVRVEAVLQEKRTNLGVVCLWNTVRRHKLLLNVSIQ